MAARVRAVRRLVASIGAAVVAALVYLLRIYQVHVSPAFPPTCRFHPSCSQYAVEALTGHGVLRGIGLTVWRLGRCHPWHPGGADPVPAARARPTDSVAAPATTAPSRRPGHHHEEQAPC